MHPAPRSFAFLALASVLTAVTSARANGRFPLANHLVFSSSDAAAQMTLRTSFGLLTSADAGRSWRWVCEPALSDVPLRDPPVVYGSDGRLVVGVDTGLVWSSMSLCAWTRPAGAPSLPVVDVTADATGHVVLAAVSMAAGSDGIARSDDGGGTWRPAVGIDQLFVATVDVAPSMPSRVYASGIIGSTAVLFRSDDGAASFHEVSRGFNAAGVVYIAAVDRTNPDVLYLRAQTGLGGTALLRSDDGGVHTREIGRTESPMLGFALSDDGRTVWVTDSRPSDGIFRSVDGSPLRELPTPYAALCLRYHAGALWMCADETFNGFALARSTDGGDHFVPVLHLRDVMGPVDCPAGTVVGDRCPALWPAQYAILPVVDAGAADVVTDASATMDAAADAGPRPSPSRPDCGCRAGSSRASPRFALFSLFIAFAVRRTRRRDATDAQPADR